MAKVENRPASKWVEGIRVPDFFPTENILSAIHYKPRPDDVFIVTYPKCGTTWSQHILTLLFRKGVPFTSSAEHFAAAPFIDATGADGVETMPRPGCIRTHIPFHLSYSSEAKYIYVTRNPKDCCVSFFHHVKNLPGHQFNGSFDEFFELFINGELDYGDYFDHLLTWYEHRNDPNVLFVTYEEMKADVKVAIFKMAAFIGEEYFKLLKEEPKVMDDIIRYSSFDYMKKSMDDGFSQIGDMDPESIRNDPKLPKGVKELFVKMIKMKDEQQKESIASNFVRKGIIGDWRNHFSPQQNKRMDDKIRQKLSETMLLGDWDNHLQ